MLHGQLVRIALIVLDTANWTGGPLPSGWQVKVNHGKPDVSVGSDSEGASLRLKSVRASSVRERPAAGLPLFQRADPSNWRENAIPG